MLSKASGIKAANFMIDKYQDAFTKTESIPHIPVINKKNLVKLEINLKILNFFIFRNFFQEKILQKKN
jgi:hypothetical protein